MRISDWSSDVCSSDLRSIEIAKRFFVIACTEIHQRPAIEHRSRVLQRLDRLVADRPGLFDTVAPQPHEPALRIQNGSITWAFACDFLKHGPTLVGPPRLTEDFRLRHPPVDTTVAPKPIRVYQHKCKT